MNIRAGANRASQRRERKIVTGKVPNREELVSRTCPHEQRGGQQQELWRKKTGKG